MTKTCSDCGRTVPAEFWRKRHWGRLCNACQKRIWRQLNSEAVEHDRETSRRWKREKLGQPGLPKGVKAA